MAIIDKEYSDAILGSLSDTEDRSQSGADEAVHALLHRGDPEAFPYLWRYAPYLKWYLSSRFSGRMLSEDIEDIVSDTLVAAFYAGHQFNPTKAKLSTWLCAIAHYQALTFLRKRKHLSDISIDTLDWWPATGVQLGPLRDMGPSSAMLKALKQIPWDYARIIYYYYYLDLPATFIAQLLGISVGTLRVRLHRGRAMLRRRISWRGL
jgi:RNA polymerase sigma-70 factor (ECF subfamily)